MVCQECVSTRMGNIISKRVFIFLGLGGVMTVKVTHIEIDEETGTARIQMTDESMEYIRKMFPDKSDQDAVQAYWELASSHLNVGADDMKVGEE